MDKLNPKLIEQIENALDIKFYDWQKDYLLDIPRVLDMRMTGRCTGKTLAYVIKLLFSDGEPLRVYDIKEIEKCSDWWSITNRINRSKPHYSHLNTSYARCEYDTGYLLDLPMLSIEDMIEYLQQLNLPLKFVLNLKPNGKWYVENYYGFSEQEELCDCLWELTKEVLNK